MKISIIKALFAASLTLLTAIETAAVPARPGKIDMVQPDGSTIEVFLHGDEYHHFYTSTDGTVLRRDASGRLAPSSLTLEDMALERSMAIGASRSGGTLPGLFTRAKVPSLGSPKVLVVLVEFSDKEFIVEDPADFYDRMFHQEGFSDYYGTGCATEYFATSSAGAYVPDIDVLGPVKVSRGYAYYGSNNRWGSDSNVSDMIVEACTKLDDTVDFSIYDTNNDGMIDNVFVIYAGQGEATGGGEDTIWPHASSVWGNNRFDGKQLSNYACANEWLGSESSGYPDGIGTFCHEFSHCLGLPDLYATTYPTPTPFTPGAWDVMDVGPYNNEGYTPPLHSAYQRACLGWIEPVEITSAMNCTLYPLSTSNEAYLIRTSRENEFFVLENRQRLGWDAYIPGHGMLVWHVDYDSRIWDSNAVSNTYSHQYCDIVEADNVMTEDTRRGDPFPGISGVTSFTSSTTPAFRTWGGESINLGLTEITEAVPYGIISFKVAGGGPKIPSPTLKSPADVTPRSFSISWSEVPECSSYRLCVYTRQGGETVYVPGYDNRNVGYVTSATVEGLEPSTAYLCTVKAVGETSDSDPSNEMAAYALPISQEYVIPVAFEATDITDTSFTASWDVIGADSYKVTVEKRVVEDSKTMFEGFDSGTTEWFTSSTTIYRNTNYSSHAPSLGLKDRDYICTPYIEGKTHSFHFYQRAKDKQDGCCIRVDAFVDETWIPVASFPASTSKKNTTSLYRFPEGTESIRLMVDEPSGKTTVYVDDIRVDYGGAETMVPVTSYNAGSRWNTIVSGLEPGTEYFYDVRSIVGGVESMPSAAIRVMTTGKSSIATIKADGDSAAPKVGVNGDLLVIEAPEGLPVAVSDLWGRLVYSGMGGSTPTIVNTFGNRGLYIVRVGNSAVKIVL